MKTRKIEVEVYEAEKGMILEVFHEGETEPVYYRRIYSFLLSEQDVVNEIPFDDKMIKGEG